MTLSSLVQLLLTVGPYFDGGFSVLIEQGFEGAAHDFSVERSAMLVSQNDNMAKILRAYWLRPQV